MSSMPHPAQADVSDLSDLLDSTSVTLTDVVLALVVFIGAWCWHAWRGVVCSTCSAASVG